MRICDDETLLEYPLNISSCSYEGGCSTIYWPLKKENEKKNTIITLCYSCTELWYLEFHKNAGAMNGKKNNGTMKKHNK